MEATKEQSADTAAKAAALIRKTPIGAPPQPPQAGTRAETEAAVQAPTQAKAELPASLQKTTNEATQAAAVLGAKQAADGDIAKAMEAAGADNPHNLSNDQKEAFKNLEKVEQMALATAGKPGCNPFLFRKQVLKPLRDGVQMNRKNVVDFCKAYTCPEKPNGTERPGPLMVTRTDMLARKLKEEREAERIANR